MASTSRRTLSAPQRPRPRTDVFKPKFPIDPFAAAAVREPWFLTHDALPSLAYQSRRDVLLVLGGASAVVPHHGLADRPSSAVPH